MKNKKLTVDEIYQANIEAFNTRRKLPYTKKEYSEAEGCTADAMRYWNECLPNADPYSKKEYSEAEGCTADAMRYWNLVFPNAKPFLESEIIATNS